VNPQLLRLRSLLLRVLPVLLAAGLMAWVIRGLDDPRRLIDLFREAARRPGWLAAGILAFGGALLCGTLRWALLLRLLRVPMRAARIVRLYAIGHFYNVLIPGATGGDVVKAGCVVHDYPAQRPEAVGSILAERFSGFIALAMLVLAVAVSMPSVFVGAAAEGRSWGECLRALALFRPLSAAEGAAVPISGAGRAAWLYCIGFGAATLAGTGVLFWSDAPRRLLRGGREGELRGWRAFLLRLYGAMQISVRDMRVFGEVFALSILNHVFTALCTAWLGGALGLSVGLVEMVGVMAVVNAVTAVSLTPGGAGVREVATSALLLNIGIAKDSAVAMSLLTYGAILLWALVGGLAHINLASAPVGARKSAPEGGVPGE